MLVYSLTDVFLKKNKKAHARFPWVHGNKEGLYLGSVLKKINQQI